MAAVDTRPTRLSGLLAGGVTAGVVLLLGSTTGLLAEAVLGIAAGALVAGGTAAMDRDHTAVRAVGSLAIAFGWLAAATGVATGVDLSVGALGLGLALPLAPVAIALGVTKRVDAGVLSRGRWVLGIAALVAGSTTAFAAMVATGSLAAPVDLAVGAATVVTDTFTRNDIAGLAAFLLSFAVVAYLSWRVAAVVPDRYGPDLGDRSARYVTRTLTGLALAGMTSASVGLLVLVVSLAASPTATPLRDALTGLPLAVALPVYLLATTTVLHQVLAVSGVLLAFALAAESTYHRLDRTSLDDVGSKVVLGTGGVGAVLGTVLVAPFVSPAAILEPRLGAELTAQVTANGTLTALLLGASVLLAVAFLLTAAFGVLVSVGFVPETPSGIALGAGLLFVGAMGAAAAGAGLVPVLVAGAGALLAWDLGENAVELGAQLGRAAETSRGEFAHGGASALVAGSSVAVAVAAGQLPNAFVVPGEGWLLVVAMSLSTTAGLAFLWLLRT
jgi:hypothetical protein